MSELHTRKAIQDLLSCRLYGILARVGVLASYEVREDDSNIQRLQLFGSQEAVSLARDTAVYEFDSIKNSYETMADLEIRVYDMGDITDA